MTTILTIDDSAQWCPLHFNCSPEAHRRQDLQLSTPARRSVATGFKKIPVVADITQRVKAISDNVD